MNRIIITTAIIALLASCGKKNKKQYSYWKVNGVEYSSNNVTAIEGYMRPISHISCQDKIRFSISFNRGDLPHNGNFPIQFGNASQNPNWVGVGFCFDTTCFIIAESFKTFLKASEQNGKAQYSLEPTWFINYNNSNDSILIEGIFNEP